MYRLERASTLQPWNVPEPIRDRFRKLRAVLRSNRPDGLCVGVCSHDSGEGVSWIASKLACAFAEESSSVVLFDANLSRPAQRTLFGTSQDGSPRAGVWSDDSPAEAAPAKILIATPSAPSAPPSTANVLVALRELRSANPVVVVDCEPLGCSAQALQLAETLDGVLFVVEAEHHRRQVIAKSLELLNRAHVPVLGTVLSKRKQYIPQLIYKLL